jgi:hypothetical protein
MVAVLALMETPAIITGLGLARRGLRTGGGQGLWHEVLLNASVVLLIGSFLIGLVGGPDGFKAIAPVFETLFRGLLCIFLLDMGLIAGRRLSETRSLTARAAALGVILPLINGSIGVAAGTLIGLDVASAAALGVLAGSASYIAVPAAMRLALPEADPGLYLSMSLGVTFPFNIIAGIPLYRCLLRRSEAHDQHLHQEARRDTGRHPLAPRLIKAAVDAGIAGYTLIPVQSGCRTRRTWRDDSLTAAQAKTIFLTIAAEDKAARFVETLAPHLDSYGMLLTCRTSKS